MPKVELFIATSLDGYIARNNGNLDWLTSLPSPELGDYGYSGLLQRIGSIIMGRKTYDALIGFGIDWPYPGFETYVLTRQNGFRAFTPNTFVIHGDLPGLISCLKEKTGKDIWLVGGGQLVRAFINEGLLDRMTISIVPVVLGEGVPLFLSKMQETRWELVKTETFHTGLVNLTYVNVPLTILKH